MTDDAVRRLALLAIGGFLIALGLCFGVAKEILQPDIEDSQFFDLWSVAHVLICAGLPLVIYYFTRRKGVVIGATVALFVLNEVLEIGGRVLFPAVQALTNEIWWNQVSDLIMNTIGLVAGLAVICFFETKFPGACLVAGRAVPCATIQLRAIPHP